MIVWIITDWAGNNVFPESFDTFDDAEDFLTWNLDQQDLDYEENRQEYTILETN